jgi:pyruvate/2-oxoglutarate dehydrogenase complex dihydrolipoamide dehydrogenase (E3) component
MDALTGAAPGSAAVLGAGPGAVIAAERIAADGARVTLITRSARLLPREDESVAAAIAGRLASAGVEIHTNASALGWAPSGITRWTAGGAPREVQTDAIFPETDLRAATAALDLPKAGVYANVMGSVVTDEEMRTSRPGIWAAGHAVSPGASLAEHSHEAELAAHNARAGFLDKRKAEPALPPVVIRTSPPAARVGLTEAEARSRFRDAIAAVAQDASGLVKIVGRRRGGRLLGAHLVGPGAPDGALFFDLLLRSEIPIGDVPDRRHFPATGPSDTVYRALRAWVTAAHGE